MLNVYDKNFKNFHPRHLQYVKYNISQTYVRIWVYLFSRFHIPSSSDALVIAKELRATKLFACSLLVIISFPQSNALRGLCFFLLLVTVLHSPALC
jgi:hypothetical protein